MRLAMIPSAYRTPFFRAVGRRAEMAGHEVFWISPNSRWARWLVRDGVPVSRILDVSRYGNQWSGSSPAKSADIERLQVLESGGSLRINDILMMDPLLVRRPRDHALRYLATCERLIRDFIVSNDIRCVTAEQTWALELLVGQVCLGVGIPHMMPHTIRIPDSRFGFFVGHRETDLLPIREPTVEDRTQAKAFLVEFRQRRPSPTYMAIDRRVLKPEFNRFRALTRHVLDLAGDPFDETSRRPVDLIVDHSRQMLRGARNRKTSFFEAPLDKPARPYVFFPLHLQPEASIDIKGSPFTAQIEIVRAMARTLPVTHDLYVKEHSVALKTRQPEFYRELIRIPGVRLITPFVDGLRLISGAEIVVSITGTAAYEAALFGKPALTIAPIFFDRIVTRSGFDPFRESIATLLETPNGLAPRSELELTEFLARLIANSFPGVVGDAFWQPGSMSAANLDTVAQGFRSALGRLENSTRSLDGSGAKPNTEESDKE